MQGQPRKVALTIDDLPYVYVKYLDSAAREKLFQDILDTLSSRNVKTTGFVIATNIVDKSHLMRKFIDSGHTVANHSYDHPNLNAVSAKTYCQNISKADSILSKYMQKKYFRYPFLIMGDTKEKKDSVISYLKNNDYTIAHVSIDNREWVYNRDYCEALAEGDTTKADSLGNQYIVHMLERAEYSDKLSREISPNKIEHILLVHMNFINSRYIGRLIDAYRSIGFEFITFEEAIKNPIYQIEDDYLHPHGVSILERIR